jgi:hypothetical protein
MHPADHPGRLGPVPSDWDPECCEAGGEAAVLQRSSGRARAGHTCEAHTAKRTRSTQMRQNSKMASAMIQNIDWASVRHQGWSMQDRPGLCSQDSQQGYSSTTFFTDSITK